jgi:hypothetical protein
MGTPRLQHVLRSLDNTCKTEAQKSRLFKAVSPVETLAQADPVCQQDHLRRMHTYATQFTAHVSTKSVRHTEGAIIQGPSVKAP